MSSVGMRRFWSHGIYRDNILALASREDRNLAIYTLEFLEALMIMMQGNGRVGGQGLSWTGSEGEKGDVRVPTNSTYFFHSSMLPLSALLTDELDCNARSRQDIHRGM